MAIPGLRNIPSEYRDLYEHTYEILTRLRDRQAELTVLMQDEKDAVKRNKYSKERTNINRWVGDVTQAPETFTGIELSKYTNKQLGQRVHTVARSLMDRFNIDPRKASAGGSTQHHADSIMQMQGAYEGASIDTIFKINQSLKEEDIYLGTNAEGRNFYDVDASTHPDFHKLTPEDQVDYSNRWAKVNDMPTATPEERIARIRASSEITQGIARRAAASPLYLGRSQAIQTAAESVQPGIVQQFGEPFDSNITGQAKLKRAQAYRGALVTFLGGGAKLEFNPTTINMMATDPFSGAVAGAVEAAKTVRANPLGAAVGVLGGLDTESVKLAREGEYGQAAFRTTAGALVGAGVEAVGKRVAPVAMKLIPQAGKMVMGAVGAPLAAGMAGYQALDIITTAATGKTLQETGQAAEQTKEELRQQGMSEYQLRRRARTGR
jgi:hypothetical protein